MLAEDYIAKLNYICSEPDNEKREAVSKQLLAEISSADFLTTVQSVFSSSTISDGLKLVTAALLKQFVKDNVKKMTFDDSSKLIDLIMKLACTETRNLKVIEELAESIKLLIIRANSKRLLT